MAAVLHDVVEDTDVSLEDLREQGFAPEVIVTVEALTKRDGEARMRAAKRAAANHIARMVKIADVTDDLDMRRLPQPTDPDIRRLKEYREVPSYLLSCGPMPIKLPFESRRLDEMDLDGPTHIRIDVEITDRGDLYFSGQDVGDASQRMWGDEDYEYWLHIHAMDKDRVLLALIEKLYLGNPSLISEFKALLDLEGIQSTFFSYV